MKTDRIQKRVALAAALLASVSFAASAYAQADKNSQEKIRLMVTALQARDNGDLQASKQALEELLKIAPEDAGVQRMLGDVNADIERQGKGESAVLVSTQANEAAAAAYAEKLEEAQAKVDEAGLPAEALEATTAEGIRKVQKQVLAAYDLIDQAYDEMDEGKWDSANASLNLAASKLPSDEYAPMADEARSEIRRARAAMAKERANIAMSDRNVSDAKSFAKEYASNEDDVAKGEKFVNKVEKFTENPYNNSIEEVNPAFAARKKKAEALIQKGMRQYLYGDWQGARSTFRQVETLDSTNITAKAYQKLISEKLTTSARLTYDATRSGMLDQVSDAWQFPTVYSGQTINSSDEARTSVVEAKLASIIIPEVNYPNAKFSEVIKTLGDVSVLYDKSSDGSKKGVNIVLLAGDSSDAQKEISINLRELPLGKILTWVTRQAGYQYDIEDETVVVRKSTTENMATSFETEDFPVSDTAITRMVGLKASTGGDSSDPFGGGGGGSGASENKEELIKNFLTKTGVDFAPGSGLAYDGTKLWVTNTSRNLEKIRRILQRYNEVKQVEIEAKFIEVNQGALKEMGFNWKVSNGDNVLFQTSATSESGVRTYNNRRLSDTLSSTVAGGTPINIKDLSGSTAVDQTVPELPRTINMASNAVNTTNTILGVINGYSVDLIVTAIEQAQGSDLLSSPKVTVTSGNTASITVSQQMRYPENWGDMQSNVGSGSSTDGGSAGVTITPGTPQEFTTVDVGVVMEVTPNVLEDGSTIELVLNPKVTEFEGFMEYGGVAVAIASNTTVTVPSGFLQPVFSIREIRTNVTVFDGATVVMGGLTREEVKSVKDQVPILGDIPFIGRLFQSKGETRQKKNLLIFVTANRISPGGSVVREQFQEMRPGSVFQNPIIVSPGGSVQRVLEDDLIKE